MDDIRPVRNEADYDWALGEVGKYFANQPELGTPDGDRFEVLLDLIGSYEAKHWPIAAADPIEAITFTMTIKGRKKKDLVELLGSKSRVSEILNRRRALTLGMIAKLNKEWGVPAETLIQPYKLTARLHSKHAQLKVAKGKKTPARMHG